MLEWVVNFIVSGVFLIIPLLILILVKFGYKLHNRKVFYGISQNSTKYGYILLISALVLCVLATSPIAGQGYDTSYFIFCADYIHGNGLQNIFRTDRPLTYLVTDIISSILNVPGRVSIPISAVVFTVFYTITTFVLVMVLTKNTLLSGISSLFVVGSNITRLTALCFVGNMLGIAFLCLFFSVVIKFYGTGKKWYFGLSLGIFISMFLSHFFTSVIAVAILTVFFLYLYVVKNREKLRSFGVSILSYITIFVVLLISNSENLRTFVTVTEVGVVSPLSTETFLQYLSFDWCSDYLWIFLLSIVGIWIVMFSSEFKEKFLTAWVLTIVGIMLFSLSGAGRIFLYLPLSILASFGLYYLIDHFFKSFVRIRKVLFVCVILFLMLVPFTYYLRMQHMNIKYFEEGPFPWDTKYLETEQLKWIKKNYDTDSVVVLTDVLYRTEQEMNGLAPGSHIRLLAEIGNNVYYGNLSNLLKENPDKRGNQHNTLGQYSSLNVDWTLENKTILLPDTLYQINEEEKSICREVANGIYAVNALTEEEKLSWLQMNG